MVRGVERNACSFSDGYEKKLTGGGSPATAELIVLNAIALGLTAADLDLFTIGMLNDLAAEMNDEGEIEATQADFDAF